MQKEVKELHDYLCWYNHVFLPSSYFYILSKVNTIKIKLNLIKINIQWVPVIE